MFLRPLQKLHLFRVFVVVVVLSMSIQFYSSLICSSSTWVLWNWLHSAVSNSHVTNSNKTASFFRKEKKGVLWVSQKVLEFKWRVVGKKRKPNENSSGKNRCAKTANIDSNNLIPTLHYLHVPLCLYVCNAHFCTRCHSRLDTKHRH